MAHTQMEKEFGPPPKSGVDWPNEPRPGRYLDAIELEPADPAEIIAEKAETAQPGVFRRVFQRILNRF